MKKHSWTLIVFACTAAAAGCNCRDFILDLRGGPRFDEVGGAQLVYEVKPLEGEAGRKDKLVVDVMETLCRRLDESGEKWSELYHEGDTITVLVPGVSGERLARIKRILGQTARLEFTMVDDPGSTHFKELAEQIPGGSGIELKDERVPGGKGKGDVTSFYLEATSSGGKSGKAVLEDFLAGRKIPDGRVVCYGSRPDTDAEGESPAAKVWRTWYLQAEAGLTGDYVEDAEVEMDAGMGQPYVALDFNAQGASIFEKLTGSNIRKRMAIVLDCFVNSAPVIMEKIGGGKARITLGAFNDAHAMKQEAEELVAVLRAGALPAPIVLVSEKMIGPAE